MNTDHLKILIDLSKTLNYTKTAKNVCLTQPAVTLAIRSLENELGIKLLNRNRSGVQLTKCGRIFINEIEPLIHQLDVSIDNVKMASERMNSSISVGYSGTILETQKVFELNQFIENHPDMTIHLEHFRMSDLKKYLLDGQCDMVFHIKNTNVTEDEFDFYKLEEGKFVVVMPKDHPLAKRKYLDLEDLSDEIFIFVNTHQCSQQQQTVQELIKKINKKESYYYIDSYTLLHELVKSHLGIAVLPDFLEDKEQKDLSLIPLNYDVVVTYGITTLKNNDNIVVKSVIKEIAKQ